MSLCQDQIVYEAITALLRQLEEKYASLFIGYVPSKFYKEIRGRDGLNGFRLYQLDSGELTLEKISSTAEWIVDKSIRPVACYNRM